MAESITEPEDVILQCRDECLMIALGEGSDLSALAEALQCRPPDTPPFFTIELLCQRRSLDWRSKEARDFFQILFGLPCRSIDVGPFHEFPLAYLSYLFRPGKNPPEVNLCSNVTFERTTEDNDSFCNNSYHGDLCIHFTPPQNWQAIQRLLEWKGSPLRHPDTHLETLTVSFAPATQQLQEDDDYSSCLTQLAQIPSSELVIQGWLCDRSSDIYTICAAALCRQNLKELRLEIDTNDERDHLPRLLSSLITNQTLETLEVTFWTERCPNSRIVQILETVLETNESLFELDGTYFKRCQSQTIQMYLALNKNRKRKILRQTSLSDFTRYVQVLISTNDEERADKDRDEKDALYLSCLYYFLRKNPHLYASQALMFKTGKS